MPPAKRAAASGTRRAGAQPNPAPVPPAPPSPCLPACSLVLEELKAYFRPELLNRMDEVVVFRQLGQPQVGGCEGVRVCGWGWVGGWVAVGVWRAGARCEAPRPLALCRLLCCGVLTHAPRAQKPIDATLCALCPPQVRRIADLELAKTAARMAERGIGLEVGGGRLSRAEGWPGSAAGGAPGSRAVRRRQRQQALCGRAPAPPADAHQHLSARQTSTPRFPPPP